MHTPMDPLKAMKFQHKSAYPCFMAIYSAGALHSTSVGISHTISCFQIDNCPYSLLIAVALYIYFPFKNEMQIAGYRGEKSTQRDCMSQVGDDLMCLVRATFEILHSFLHC